MAEVAGEILIVRLRAVHGGVVAAELERRQEQPRVRALRHAAERCAQEGIRRDAARADHIARVRLMHRLLEARHERMHDRRAERGRKALPVERFALLLGVVCEVDDRRLEPGERKIERRILDAAVGQRIALRVAVLREAFDKVARVPPRISNSV